MDRRNVALIASLSLVWMSWIGLQIYLAGKKPPVADKPEADAVAQLDDNDKKGDAEQEAEKKDGDATAPSEKEPAAAADAAKDKPEVGAVPGANAAGTARQHLALGSADPISGYAAVYYFDNRGATVECVELNGARFKSVEDYSGYLGRLNLTTPTTGGAEVRVVGPGTPAALAKGPDPTKPGLVFGDVIQAIDGEPVHDAPSLISYLREKTRPDQTIKIGISRGGAPLELTAVLTRPPLAVVQPESHTYKMPNGAMQLTPQDPLSLGLTLESIGTNPSLKPEQAEFAKLPSLYNSNWQIEQQGEGFVEFSFTLSAAAIEAAKLGRAGPLKIFKRYTAAKSEKVGDPNYHLDLQVRVQNLGEEGTQVGYRLEGPTGLPLEGWWYSTKLSPVMFAAAGARDVVWDQTGVGHELLGCPKIVSDTRQAEKDKKPVLKSRLVGDGPATLEYMGVDTQFFASAVQPQPTADGQKIRFRALFPKAVQDVTWIPKTRLRTADVSFFATTSAVPIDAGGELKHDYRVFFGPKDPAVLGAYKLDSLVEYGWPIFEHPAKILRAVLNGLYGLTWLIGMPNYGISIILLTVIVRTCMIPVSLKQARSAAKMQELAPEIQKIKDKYPDDPMKQHTAVQELYKKHDFNMFAGCLPVFIQLPIFIGLYRCLSVDIDLRDASLFPGFAWASNLAGPDKLFRWDSWMPAFIADDADGWLGPFFNVFPLITVTLFLIQQKMFTPPATDEQTKMQQQMMTYMTMFMGVMFYKVPAGLCIYFITSSLWGICERKLLPKSKPKTETVGGTNEGDGGGPFARLISTKPSSPNGSSAPRAKRPKQRR